MHRIKYPIFFLIGYSVIAIITGLVEQAWYYDIVNSESNLEPYSTEYFASMPIITKVCYHIHFDILRFPIGTLLADKQHPVLQQITLFSFIFNSILACGMFLFIKKYFSKNESKT